MKKKYLIISISNCEGRLVCKDNRDLIDRVTDACIQLNPWELVERSHTAGGPWNQSFTGSLNTVIPKEITRTYVRNH